MAHPQKNRVVKVSSSADEWDNAIEFHTQTMGEPNYSDYPPTVVFHQKEHGYDLHLTKYEQDLTARKKTKFENLDKPEKVEKWYQDQLKQGAQKEIEPQELISYIHNKNGVLALTPLTIASVISTGPAAVAVTTGVVHNPNYPRSTLLKHGYYHPEYPRRHGSHGLGPWYWLAAILGAGITAGALLRRRGQEGSLG